MFKSHSKTRLGPQAWLFALLAAAVTFIVYIPALNNGFVGWDDWAYVYMNNDISTLDWQFVRAAFTRPMINNWHPLTMIAYAVDYRFWGLDPWGYHLSSVILHAVDAGLVVIVAVKLSAAALRDDPSAGGKSLYIGVAAGLLFGLHPFHVESVAWVSEKKDVLSCLFFLLSLLAYLGYNGSGSRARSAAGYLASLFFFALALMSKPMAISLPLVLLMADYYPLGRFAEGGVGVKRVLLEKLPFFALSAFSALLTIWAQSSAIVSVDIVPFSERIFIAARAVIFYSYKMLAPVKLGPYYPLFPQGGLFNFEYIGALILFLAISAVAVYSLKSRWKVFGMAWIYFVVTLAPVLGIMQAGGQAAADRYTYIPSIAPFILAGALVVRVTSSLAGSRATLARVVVLLLVAGAMTPLTVRQIGIWKDDITLWTAEIDIYPQRAYTMLAVAYNKKGDVGQEIANYTNAIEYGGPQLSELYLNRGAAYKMAGNGEMAMRDYARAIEADPSNGKAYNNLANSLREAGFYARAIENYRKAAAFIPGNPAIYYNIGVTYYQAGDVASAVENMEKSASMGFKQAEAMLEMWRR